MKSNYYSVSRSSLYTSTNLSFFSQVNPNSIAAIDGRIRKGDRILQVLTSVPELELLYMLLLHEWKHVINTTGLFSLTPSYKKIQVKKTFQEKEKKFLSDNFFFHRKSGEKKMGDILFSIKKKFVTFSHKKKKKPYNSFSS